MINRQRSNRLGKTEPELLVQHLAKISVTLGDWVICRGLVQERLVDVTERVDVLAADIPNVVGSLHSADADAADIDRDDWRANGSTAG